MVYCLPFYSDTTKFCFLLNPLIVLMCISGLAFQSVGSSGCANKILFLDFPSIFYQIVITSHLEYFLSFFF